jgi:nitrogen fixation NifU-like protein
MLTAIVVSVVFSATAHHFWWDSHPGSESAFHQKAPWYGVAGGLLFVAAYVAYGFYQEYWPIFLTVRRRNTMAYSDKVVDHYSNPRNVGTLDKSSNEVGTGLVGAPECGDVMRLQIKVNPETQVIEEAKFKTFGCGSAIASSSLATEWVKGKTIAEAMTISNTDIVKELALPPVKIHCSVLAEDAIRAAIGDWKTKNGVAEESNAAQVVATA